MRNCMSCSSPLNPRQREFMRAFLTQSRREPVGAPRSVADRARRGDPPRSEMAPAQRVDAALRVAAETVRVRANSFTPKKATLGHKSISLDTVRPSGANQLRASRPIWGARLRHEMSGGAALEIAVALPRRRGFGASAAI